MRARNNLLLLLLFIVSQSGAVSAASVKHKKKSLVDLPPSVHAYVLTPLDKLQEDLKTGFKSQAARTLFLASQAFDRKDYEHARLFANKAIGESFGDLARWVSAGAEKKEAELAFDHQQFAKASQFASDAKAKLIWVENNQPYSPVLHAIPKEVAGDELIMAKAKLQNKSFAEAKRLFESSFQRLMNVGQFNLLTPSDLLPYARACQAQPGGLCENWLNRISQAMAKNPKDFKILEGLYPAALERSKPSKGVVKNTQAYHAPDMDTTAYENAFDLIENKKNSQAITALRQFIDEYPKSVYRYRARFWLAQCLDDEKRSKEANALYADLERDTPLSFFGLAASLKTHDDIAAHIDAQVPWGLERDSALGAAEAYHLDRAQKLITAKAYELASLELKEIHPRDALSNPFLAYLAMVNGEAKNYNHAFGILSELAQRGFEGFASSFFMRMIFPLENYELIKKIATENKVDSVLVLSLIKQESGFDHKISSSVGAVGLMQLMSYTAIETKPDLDTSSLDDPAVNVDVGTRYLKKLLNRFNGNIVYSLAAYNAGPNAVDRWIREQSLKGKNDSNAMLAFIESIPYHETKDYVTSIIRNYFWYSQRLHLEKKGLDYFWTESAT
jgi:TolA-binding protein